MDESMNNFKLARNLFRFLKVAFIVVASIIVIQQSLCYGISITNVSVPNTPMKLGDTVTATITVTNDGGVPYSLKSGDVNGFPLENLTRVNNTTYTSKFTIAKGGLNVPAESNISVNNVVMSNMRESIYKRLGGTGDDMIFDMVEDSAGNFIVSGMINGNADLNGDGDSTDGGAESTSTTYGGDDLFISKFDAKGMLLWTKRLGGTGNDGYRGCWIDIDSANNIVVVGDVEGNADLNGDGDSTDGGAESSSAIHGKSDIFISKFTSIGTLMWSKRLGGNDVDTGKVTIDSSDNIIISGYVTGQVDLNGDGDTSDGGAEDFLPTIHGYTEIFISKFNSSGTWLWAKRFGGLEWDLMYERCFTTDSSNNIIIAWGTESQTHDINGDGDTTDGGAESVTPTYTYNLMDVIVAKYNSSGSLLWAKKLGSSLDDLSQGLQVDTLGNVYVSGRMDGGANADLNGDGDWTDGGAESTTATYGGTWDAFISKFNSSGTFQWSKRVGGTAEDCGGGISFDSSNNVYFAGVITGNADLNGDGDSTDAGAESVTPTFGNMDVFISKFTTSGTFQWAKRLGGNLSDGWFIMGGVKRGPKVLVDSKNNVNLFGIITGDADLNGDVESNDGGAESVTATYGNSDIFISKFDSNGDVYSNDTTLPYTASIIQSNDPILTLLSITNVTVPNTPMKSGDTVTATITVTNDGGVPYALKSGNVNGFPLENLTRVNNTTYTSKFTIANGGLDVPAESNISVNNVVMSNMRESIYKRLGGIGSELSSDMVEDSEGNFIVTGKINGNADLNGDGDSTDGGAESTSTTYGGDDFFISKFDAKGMFLWTKRLGGTSDDGWRDSYVDIDSENNIVVVGDLFGNADLNGDGDSTDGGAESASAIHGSHDIFISKFTSTGAHIWSKRLGGTGEDTGKVTIDSSDNIIISGYVTGQVDLNGDGDTTDGGAENFLPTIHGNTEIFISKFNSSGSWLWAKRFGGNGWDLMYRKSITTDSSDNIIMGWFTKSGTIDINGDGDTTDGGVESVSPTSTYGDDYSIVSKYNSSGSLLWAKKLGNTKEDIIVGVQVDTFSNVYVTGAIDGTVNADLNGDGDSNDGGPESTSATYGDFRDAFISKFNSSGTFQWAKRLGGTGVDAGAKTLFDSSNNVYIVGTTAGNADLNGDGDSTDGGAESVTPTFGIIDLFISKFNTSGIFQWAKRLGGNSNDTRIVGLVDSKNNLILFGSISGNADLNGDGDSNDGGPESVTATYGGSDMFISKFDSNGDFYSNLYTLPYSATIIRSNPIDFELSNSSVYGGQPVGSVVGNLTFIKSIANQDGFGFSGKVRSKVIGGNISMVGYKNWPAGLTGTNPKFQGGVYDGSNLWIVPRNANQLVKVAKDGTMTGYDSWPSGITNIGNNAFNGGVFDGNNVWLVPRDADRVVKVASDGTMTGYNSWPTGISNIGNTAFMGGVYDGSNVWLVPRNADRLVKVASDGTMTGYNNWPTGFTKSTSAFCGGVFDGSNIWLVPENSDRVVKVAADGTMTGYNSWPAGTTNIGNGAFCGGTFDGSSVWLIPANADRVIKIASDGTMTGFANWPAGTASLGNWAFFGGTYDGNNLWMLPLNSDRVIKLAKDGTMTGYMNWPAGFTKSGMGFFGGVNDGSSLWMIPNDGSTLIRLSGDNNDSPGVTYSLIAGTGDDDNGKFTISGNIIKTNQILNLSVKKVYSIRAQVEDSSGNTFQKKFTINLIDKFEFIYTYDTNYVDSSWKQIVWNTTDEMRTLVSARKLDNLASSPAWNSISNGHTFMNDKNRYMQIKVSLLEDASGNLPTLSSINLEQNSPDPFISLDTRIITILPGISFQASYHSIPYGVPLTRTFSWVSTNPSIFTVDNTGKIRGVSDGTAQLKIYTSNGILVDVGTVNCSGIDVQ